jgi:hypothetical protein
MMQLPSDFPAGPSAGFQPGFVGRMRNRIAPWFHAKAGFTAFGWSPARTRWLLFSVIVVGLAGGGAALAFMSSRSGPSPAPGEESPSWNAISRVDLKNLTTQGKNPYFNLVPGYRLCYANGDATRTVTVRRKTKVVDGVETRVVEEKEMHGGRLTKVVWRYYAIDKTTSALYCFGVHNQSYFKGRLLGHSGWRSGAKGAIFTLILPANPKVGDALFRNHSPSAPRRQTEIIAVAQKVTTPAGAFADCVSTQSNGSQENKVKVFAPGVGLVQDGQFALVKALQTVPRKKTEAIVN